MREVPALVSGPNAGRLATRIGDLKLSLSRTLHSSCVIKAVTANVMRVLKHRSVRRRLIKASEVLVNISIILVAIILGAVLVKDYLLPRDSAPADGLRIRTGAEFSVPDVEWTKANQTAVLILSEDCHYCTDSASFYVRLVQSARERSDRVIAALPQDTNSARSYLARLGVVADQVIRASPTSLGTQATPTLVLVDNCGVVRHVWVGQLSAEKEREVLGRL